MGIKTYHRLRISSQFLRSNVEFYSYSSREAKIISTDIRPTFPIFWVIYWVIVWCPSPKYSIKLTHKKPLK